jgi:Xaa-Pro aminopeptidase
MRPPIAAALALLLLALPAVAGELPDSQTGVDLRKEHAARRAALAAALPEDSLAILVAGPDDPVFAPRPDAHYFWLTGITEPGGVLLLWPPAKKGEPHGERLLLPPRSVRDEVWIGPRLYPGKEAEQALGIAATGEARRAVAEVKARLEGRKAVLVALSGRTAGHVERLLGETLRESKVARKDIHPVVGALRLVKSPEEIARIRRASELSAEGHRRAMESARPGMPEYAVQAVFEAACREGGCRRQAYDSIVGSGPNSCILHYGRNRRVMEEGDLVLIDAGGEYLGYATDVTRTWPVGAKFSEEQAKAYDAVLAAQAAGVAAAKPGATFKDVDDACRRALEERGFPAQRESRKPAPAPPDPGAGSAPAPAPVPVPAPAPAVQSSVTNVLPHGVCHWVGLDVHDPNGDVPLVPGAVFTIEPGAYFPDLGWGIRIEDTYLVKEDGTLDCLSKDAPKERAAVEALRAAALK